jgi:hypothetical protein
MTISQEERIKNFEVIYEVQMMAPIQNDNKHEFEKKILLLIKFDVEKTHFQRAKTHRKTITQVVVIRNFEVIYEEQIMAYFRNHSKHEFET